MKENHLFTFNQFLLFLAVARACVQLSVRGQGGERRRALSGAVRKYICQQRGRDRSERKEAAVTVAFNLLMTLDRSCLGKSLSRGKSGEVWKEWAQLQYLWLLPVASCSQEGLLRQGSSQGSLSLHPRPQQSWLLEFAPICSCHMLAGVAAEEHPSQRDGSSWEERGWCSGPPGYSCFTCGF